MALFDSIISGAADKLGLGDKAGTVLASLLALMTNQDTGGFSGFINKFKDAGLGDTVSSWISSGDNAEVSNEQIESAIGSDTIGTIAEQAGIDPSQATSALAYMTPQVVSNLTPDGEVPDEESLLSKIGGFLSGFGGTAAGVVAGAAGVAGAVASGAADKAGDAVDAVGDAAGATVDKGKEVIGDAAGAVGDVAGAAKDKVGDAAGAVTGAAGAATDKVGDAFGSVTDSFDGDGDGGSILKWLLPLLLLGLLIAIGFYACRDTSGVKPVVNSNTNATNTSDTNEKTDANANSGAANAERAKDGERTLGEVTLADGTKLKAYPGGIEDQLVKFLGTDEYKNATEDDLKKKWFDFDDLNFEFGSTTLVPESKRQLDNITAILKGYPDVKIKIGGYTDKKGSDAGNKSLSDKRAKAVKAALDKSGVGAQVPEAEGFGEEFAKVDEGASDKEREADRKTSVRLMKSADKPADGDEKKEADKTN